MPKKRLLWWARHLFVPHHTNNCKAKILHPSALSILVGFFLFYQFILNFYLLVSPSVLGFASDIAPERVVEITNQKRAEQGLNPLTVNGQLNEAAQRKAGDMFAFNYWSHVSPSGRSPWSFFQEVGYKYLFAGENLARDFMNSDAVVSAWMNSPTHRDNILNGNYKEIGLAVVNGTLNGVETTLVVQVFGAPISSPVAQKPATTVKPTLTPTPVLVTPTPVEQQTAAAVQVPPVEEQIPLARVALAQASQEVTSPPLLSPFLLTKTIAVFLLGLILGALLLDIILVYQKKIIRLSGRNVAHLIFIGGLLLAVILTTPGAIL
ncbi:hypothetical protein FJZ41_01425 [Candidatus Shapirobacteria bacterium]|nr:hypothetical protein [Candidatus Shapirobacteria bacterium]